MATPAGHPGNATAHRARKPAPTVAAFERMLLRCSLRFTRVPPSAIDGAITESLRELVEFLGVDRSTLSSVSPDSGHFAPTHSWGRPGTPPVSPMITSRRVPWVDARMRAGVPVVFTRLDDLPSAAATDREHYASAGLRAHVALPLFVDGTLGAVLGIGMLRADHRWPRYLLARLALVAEVFASAVARRRVQQEIERASAFERLAARVLAGLLVSQAPGDGPLIDDALRAIGEVLEVDSVGLSIADERGALYPAHRWLSVAAPDGLRTLDASTLGWLSMALESGRELIFGRREELPVEAAADRARLAELSVHAGCIIPLHNYGNVVGAFTLIQIHEDRHWPPNVVDGARMLAQVFASLLARERASREAARDREALQHMTRVSMLGQMSASIAHQLNQPLTAILGNAEAALKMLARTPVDLDELRAICGDIVEQDNRAADVIRRLGALYRRGEMKRAPVDLNALVGETVDLLRSELLRRNVSVDVQLDPAVPVTSAGAVHLQQVLMNLIINAADAMAAEPGDRTVRIVTHSAESAVECSIGDCGTGIPEEHLARVFEAFFTTKAGGMGIGLAICQSIVEAHHGTLTATNNATRGATFRMRLPREAGA